MDQTLLTASQVAKRLAVAVRTPYKWHERGELPAVVLPGRTLRWRSADIDALIAGKGVLHDPPR